MFAKDEIIYITKVAYPLLHQVQKRCRPLTVEHTTVNAILVRDGTEKQWFPKKLLKPAMGRNVFLLPRWFDLEPDWQTRVGIAENAGHSQDVPGQSEATPDNSPSS